MDDRAQDRDASAGLPDDAIAPVDFRRADPRDARAGRRLPLAALAIGAALLVLGATAAFTFLAHPTLVVVKPTPETLRLSGGPSFAIGDRYLLLRGAYRIEAELAGHHPLDELFRVPLEDDLLELEMRRLPGRLTLDVEPPVEVEVRVDGTVIGRHPGTELLVEPGEREISLHSERWLPVSRTVRVEGLGREVALSFELEPAWADVRVTSAPPGARLRIDDEDTGLVTPAEAEILAGSRVLTLHLDGYEPARQRIELVPSQTLTLPTFELERLAGRLRVSTDPAGASVTVNDAFRGRTPLTLELAPTQTHRIELFKSGHEPETRRVRVESDVDSSLDVALAPVRGELRVSVGPSGARVRVDGEEMGPADQVLLLSAEEHEIEVYLDGHVSYTTRVTPRPEFAQEIALTLKTYEQARRDAMKAELIAGNGQTLVLIQPEGPFQLGASRREPGRRANEVLREVEITRPFYIATTELTNAQYRAFESGHDAGSFEQYDLDGDDLPVVNINWEAAARYCNWLSERDGLRAVYRIENCVVRGFDPTANGYRMPTEAEWAYVARTQADGSLLRFPWGDTRRPPEDRMGNYADRASETLLARSIPDYTDGNVTTAPVGKFDPNRFGLHDIGGNVAEWINDFYAATSTELPSGVQDPLGPPRGEYHVIRGSSWMHGQLVDLRLSFRDYGRQGRPDVGLRIARWFE
ncbi:MAG: SUMF1/EgtB/PvdO family nonheme iron enzyme [Pseudomonadales bacterium]|jgi:formylglycine-generating enzyme required for sulfatase activity|nr:SUMF1/EgtB/PvdO family nonheme iron enzyme [Pseudomonadales bacterium]